jgi:adenylylsulfate kinase
LQVTGVSAPYERPEQPDITLKTDEYPIDACVEVLLHHHRKVLA